MTSGACEYGYIRVARGGARYLRRRLEDVGNGIVPSIAIEVVGLERFRNKGPGVLAHMYRGVAQRA